MVAIRFVQSYGLPASKTRDSNVPDEAYGVIRIQSTVTAAPPLWASLITGRIAAPIAMACVSTTVPSIEKITLVGVQSTRKRWGDPIQVP